MPQTRTQKKTPTGAFASESVVECPLQKCGNSECKSRSGRARWKVVQMYED